MTKTDDSSLDPDQLRVVEAQVRQLLDRAAAWERFPTPVDDILAAAKLKVAPTSAFDPKAIMAFMLSKAANAAARVGALVKSALGKTFGIYDSGDSVIHIDDTVVEAKQTFLKLHETGHHELPLHRKLFRIFQDCEKNLAPDIADQFEREANNFARCALFQATTFAAMAADCPLEIKTPMRLAKKFGASVYAACREFARSHHRACVVYVLEPIAFCEKTGARAAVRRIEPSPAFRAQFGTPAEAAVTLNHALGPVLPVGRKMTRPTTVRLTDLNGVAHECLAEAFDTTYNVIILLFPVKALTATRIIVPSGVVFAAAGRHSNPNQDSN